MAALRAASGMTAVGFFGRARADIDHLPIHELETGVVDTLETISGVLCYYDVALAEGGYGRTHGDIGGRPLLSRVSRAAGS